MENIALTQQIADFNRVAADNTWNAVSLIQNQAERNIRTMIEQGNGVVEEGRRIIEEWTNEIRKGQQAIQSAWEESQAGLEQLFAPPAQPRAAAKNQKAK